jgi:hypothetical protein
MGEKNTAPSAQALSTVTRLPQFKPSIGVSIRRPIWLSVSAGCGHASNYSMNCFLIYCCKQRCTEGGIFICKYSDCRYSRNDSGCIAGEIRGGPDLSVRGRLTPMSAHLDPSRQLSNINPGRASAVDNAPTQCCRAEGTSVWWEKGISATRRAGRAPSVHPGYNLGFFQPGSAAWARGADYLGWISTWPAG